jgi:hypothetical protein
MACALGVQMIMERIHIVTQRLKGETVEPEETTVAREQLSKHVSAAINTRIIIQELWDMEFSVQSVPWLFTRDQL